MSAIEQPAVGATLADLRARRAEILDAARNRGAQDVRVFGSIARGSAAPNSDVDLLVAFEAGRSLFDLGGLVADLEALLGRSVDVVTEAELRPHVRERVLADAVRAVSRDLDRLRDIVEYLDKIEAHRPAGVDGLRSDEVLAAAIVRWIEIVGEAAANVSGETRAQHPKVPWTEIVAMRNQLIHAYPDVNLDLVWGVVEHAGPQLRSVVADIIETWPLDGD